MRKPESSTIHRIWQLTHTNSHCHAVEKSRLALVLGYKETLMLDYYTLLGYKETLMLDYYTLLGYKETLMLDY
jgi:hypothetical protein